MKTNPFFIATRGSPLALAQANLVLALCREKFPDLPFELRIIKTTGDKLRAASMSSPDPSLPKGLFTKELETALLNGRASLAVHSLKDLPTELPDGLMLAATGGERADARDVLIYKNTLPPGLNLARLPRGLTIATSSARRKAQLLAARPDFNVVEIRGNVATRLDKLAREKKTDATILAAAGLERLKFRLTENGGLSGPGTPDGLLAVGLETDEWLPCTGQGAIGLEIRADDKRAALICRELNDETTFQCVTAERALLCALGGGCQMPLGAHATPHCGELLLRAVWFLPDKVRRAEARGAINDAAGLGKRVAALLKV